jgi:hypothetical protein
LICRKPERHLHPFGPFGYPVAGDRETILATVCNGYIEKPIDPDSFVEQVRGFLPQDEKGGIA